MQRIKVGMTVRDCDPRSGTRTGKIVELFPNGIGVKWSSGTLSVITAHRLHTEPARTTGVYVDLASGGDGPRGGG